MPKVVNLSQIVQDAKSNPALLAPDKSAKVARMDHDGGQGKDDKKEQRRKKATSEW